MFCIENPEQHAPWIYHAGNRARCCKVGVIEGMAAAGDTH